MADLWKRIGQNLIWSLPFKRLKWELLLRYQLQPPQWSVKRKIRKKFYSRMKRYPDLDSPTRFNDKLQYLKLHHRQPLMPLCADKAEVRAHLAALGLADYLIPSLGTYTAFEDIPFDELPNSFVLKVTHNSGGVFVVEDKSTLDRATLQREVEDLLRLPYIHGISGGEWHYLYIKPQILIEAFVADSNGELLDYKFHCFGGKAHYVHVDFDRHSRHTRRYYDRDWHDLDFSSCYPLANRTVARPVRLNEMLDLAETLSRPFPYARIDLYDVDGRVYFGEITFYHDSGRSPFDPENWDTTFGELLELDYSPASAD